jgi:hypothetical protein
MTDPEHILQCARDGRWDEAWRAVHAAATDGSGGERVDWAVATITDAFFEALPDAGEEAGGTLEAATAEALETAVLLHSGGQHRLQDDRFGRAVERLVRHHRAAGDPAAARRFARFRPGAPACAAVLTGEGTAGRDGPAGEAPDASAAPVQAPDPDAPEAGRADDPAAGPDRAVLDHAASDRIQASVVETAGDADRTTGLFRSDLERDFFHAVRSVFPTYAPYPNVALTSVVDVDAVRPHLTGEERSLLYTGVVDCVLFDPHADYRPVAFFEIDSPYHDAPDRRASDARKDRILAVAGHRLIRLRPRAEAVGEEDFAGVLRALSRRSGTPATPRG